MKKKKQLTERQRRERRREIRLRFKEAHPERVREFQRRYREQRRADAIASLPKVDREALDYESIKALSKELGRPAETLIALSSMADPFFILPSRMERARWFAGIWKRLKLQPGVHVRRIHYILISQKTPVRNHKGVPYQNTEDQWHDLSEGSRDARYLELVPASAFIDRRNDEPIIHLDSTIGTAASLRTSFPVPYMEKVDADFPYLPELHLDQPTIPQRFHVEIWCEKTTMNDVLEPLAEGYGCNLITGSGELSLTACENLVERALANGGRPVRILYISDFDPGGMSMPVAVARKIEHRIYRDRLNIDLQVRPIVLTLEQCVQYRLPRTPIKETERRAARFEQKFGEGATELDALEALRPGQLEEIVEREIGRYYDSDLKSRIGEAASDLDLDTINEDVHGEYQDRIAELEAAWSEVVEQNERKIAAWREQAEPVWRAMTETLAERKSDLDKVEWPEPAEGDEDDDPLFDSRRGYVEQIDRYKQFQGKRTTRKERNGGTS